MKLIISLAAFHLTGCTFAKKACSGFLKGPDASLLVYYTFCQQQGEQI